MKATVERATLLKCLAHIQSVVERRNTIPILSNVLIEARAEGLRLMATDLDLQVVETIPATIDLNGATTVSAHTLFDIVRKLSEGSQVELAVAGDKMTVVANRSRFSLADAEARRFPGDRRNRAADVVHPVGQGPARPDRQHALCHFDRGNALLSQRHLHPCRRWADSEAARRCHRWPPPRPHRARSAARRCRHAGGDRAAQVRQRGAQAARRAGRRCADPDRAVVVEDPLPPVAKIRR